MASNTRNNNNTHSKNTNCDPCMFVKLKSIQAEFHCEDCSENYCDECALHHAKFRVFRNHRVLPLTDSADSIEANMARLDVCPPLGSPGANGATKGAGNEYGTMDAAQIDMYIVNVGQVVGSDDADWSLPITDKSDSGKQSSIDSNSTSFDVNVLETELTRRVNEIGKIDLPNMATQLRLDNDGIVLITRSRTLITFPYTVIRRYGKKERRVVIELGRSFRYGAGTFKFECDMSRDLMKLMKDKLSKTT